MASILEGKLAKAIYKGFKGKLLKGTLTRKVPGVSSTLNDFGDPTDVGPQNFKFEGFVEEFSAFFRSVSGIPDTDVNVLIFKESIKIRPLEDDKVSLRGKTYQVRRTLAVDPAEATYSLQCFEVKV